MMFQNPMLGFSGMRQPAANPPAMMPGAPGGGLQDIMRQRQAQGFAAPPGQPVDPIYQQQVQQARAQQAGAALVPLMGAQIDPQMQMARQAARQQQLAQMGGLGMAGGGNPLQDLMLRQAARVHGAAGGPIPRMPQPGFGGMGPRMMGRR